MLFYSAKEKPSPSRCTTIGMRLPLDRIDGKRVAASKPVLSEVEGPQALGMVANKKNGVLIFDF